MGQIQFLIDLDFVLDVFCSVGPLDSKFIDDGGVSDSEMNCRIILGKVGGTAADFSHLSDVVCSQIDSCAEGLGVVALLPKAESKPAGVVA